MVSNLKKRADGRYYCSNCMLLQPAPLKTNCAFCGDWFSNFSSVAIQIQKEQFANEIKDKGVPNEKN